MSEDTVLMYKFKPFEVTVLKNNHDPLTRPFFHLGRRIACNDSHVFLYECYSKQNSMTDVVAEFWKYSFDLGEWKIIPCKNIPRFLDLSSAMLSGNIIIICLSSSNHICLGNFSNEYEEGGMRFEELKASGDIPLNIFKLGVVIDSKYIYSIGGYGYGMDVHRLDLSTKTWELLYKSSIRGRESWTMCQCQPLFYKGRIYLFGNGRGDSTNMHNKFSENYTFDVTTKNWEFLPAKQDRRVSRPGYPINQCVYNCVQCLEKPNFVYICGGFSGIESCRDVWRFDLDSSQWEKLIDCRISDQVYLPSAAITPAGRLCCYNSGDITSAWITIPKLKVICWEAMVHYFKDQMLASSDTQLKEVGLPREFYERIIEMRRPDVEC